MYLKKVDIKEFKKAIFKEYKKMFPRLERKTYMTLKKSYNHHITDIIEVIEKEQFVGFIITNFLKDNPYVQLEYIVILPKYQNKGYGTNAIKLLKELYKDYGGIFIEIEKAGEGKSEEENQIRQRRAKFYEKLGFHKMGFDLELYKIIYSPYILPCSKNEFSDEKAIKYFFEIYNATLGKRRVRKNYKINRKL